VTQYARHESRQVSRRSRSKRVVGLTVCAVLVLAAAIALAINAPWRSFQAKHSVRYLGVYEPDAPVSYSEVNQFAREISWQPNLVSYYSSWLEPFSTSFATSAAKHGAVTLVQLDPENVSLEGIAHGRYDAYLRSYAAAVKAFHGEVVLSFGHEMNGNWYSWGREHTSPGVFVAAWRRVVNEFRIVGARNVIWLWTVNIINTQPFIPAPGPWWPGKAYVDWVGIDGYYYSPSWNFASLFGPTIVAVRSLTRDPILIAETGASNAAGQAAKITDLFQGIQSYGLLGFVWFDVNDVKQALDWRLDSPAALAAYADDAKAFMIGGSVRAR